MSQKTIDYTALELTWESQEINR